ncbi:type I polyketide synthase [Streptomyces sp. NBC_00347]|uniref:type I polyketide synthase n=1 Tax=Streptomyces sp. NBC_00347 TaxID=2975721 RepID=UPI00224FAEB5|nr:type I polyketide synthase [Streptomyces sp. NBC_00347]MCX5128436.1 SDR family NAD(P)-dependent oxidoreductase [Streptomyces sp. NBC_00347]
MSPQPEPSPQPSRALPPRPSPPAPPAARPSRTPRPPRSARPDTRSATTAEGSGEKAGPPGEETAPPGERSEPSGSGRPGRPGRPERPERSASARQPGRLRAGDRDLVVAVSPFEEPNPRIVTAAERAGALGLLDLGRDAGAARRAMAEIARRLGAARYGVRVPAGCPVAPGELPAEVDTVLLADPALHTPDGVAGWAAAAGRPRVWAEITDPAEAAAATAAGVEALVAKGHEAGGRVGGTTTFVLLQQLLADPAFGLPVRAFGGIGPHTAAAAVAGGAAGVLVDVQLALTPEGEAGLPAEVAAAVRAMDGSETRLLRGHRVYARPDLTPPQGPVAPLLGARDLRTQLLPVGQDGAAAARLAARHRTTGGILQAIRSAVAGHLAAVVRARPLGGGHGPGRPLPVAQGPMTRVSDQAAFAEAVAAAGGVPYLALAVMEGPQVRRLLAETAERLGERPWGVGMLGFAPAELRAEQLEAVAEVRPPYAIIAGGTPGQAAPLEAAGTRTHLHVPSPGLLERYLADGARRFVFEGLECGGHVGPRASFPLWEEQIELLLACPEPAALDVLFAGGIHDARSAAMAAAAAAPLAERGARVGVLMGTAYLFTEEAVAAGAVLPRFQRAALECADTVLLHTAPGHATRCAVTPYVDTFEATRQRLAEGGAEPREVWEELERLNLGRLRIASKGLRRGPEGDGLESVDEEQQGSEGLFMLGQAATLRSGTTTVAALHAEVTEGATELLDRRARELAGPEPEGDRAAASTDAWGAARPDPLDVAVVGMACAYPGAPDLAAYWGRILDGSDAVTEVPAERWDPELHFDPDPARAGERTPSRWGGFLGPMPFDALAHGIPPASLAGIEPVQLLALEISARALADAGYGKDREFDRSRTSVVFGAEAGTELAGAYGLRALYPGYLGELPPELDEQLPRLTEDSFPGVLANVIAGRVANRLDLGGANCTVDAACASSLAALDLACRQLRDKDSDMVLCGGADVHNGINDYLLFSSVRALSPAGRCRPFDASADGIALGEGVGALVLKRLADAERDGDRVYAVIKAVGAASDGRSLGLTAPRPEGQRRALDRAYERAGISPAEVGLIEAHGTGTVVGDTTELAVLTSLFTESGAAPGACALGSVKSQIGHTKCAAGLAGLIKAVRAVHSGVRPPTLHLDAPVPAWNAENSPFTFDSGARPWAVPAERRIAGVSAFGFGGTNYHAVLTGYAGAEEPRHGLEEWPAELFCFRGEDRRAAGRAMARLAARLEENDAAGRPWALRDLAAETAAGTGAVRVAVVAADLDELAARLERARAFTPGEGVHVREESAEPGQVAFLFPGQGSQRPGMLGELFTAFPRLRELLDTAPGAVVSAMFPPAAFTAQGRTAQRAAVTDTRVAQPALGLAGSAAHLLLGELGVHPDCVAGHSYGELTALWAAGVWDQESLLRLSARRAEAILTAAGTDPGSMAAVTAAPEEVREIAARTGCVIANHNAPRQCVISGPAAAVAEAVTALRDAGLSASPLPVACAFHSEVVAGAATALAEELAGTELADAAVPVWSNTTAGPYPATADAVRDLVARQVAEPVRFVEQVEHMYAAGVRTFVETGPGRVLSGLVGRILHDRPHTVVPLDVPGEHGLLRLVTALAELAAAGVPVAPEALFRGRTRRLPERAPRRPGWLVDGHLVRTRDGNPVPGGLRPARRVHVAVSEGKGAQQMTQPTNGTEPAERVGGPGAVGNGVPDAWGPAGSSARAGAPVAGHENGRFVSNGHGVTPGAGGPWLPGAGAGAGAGAGGGAGPVGSTGGGLAEPGNGGPAWGGSRLPGGGPGVGSGPLGGSNGGSADALNGRAGLPAAGAVGRGGDGRQLRTSNGALGAGLEPPSGQPAWAGARSGHPTEHAAPAQADRREEAVLEYLRGSRELVQAQRDVMIGYLASTAPSWTGSDPAVPGYRPVAGPAAAILPSTSGALHGHEGPQGVWVASDRLVGQGLAGPQGAGGARGMLQNAAPAAFGAEPRPDGQGLVGGVDGAWSGAGVGADTGVGAGAAGPWPGAAGSGPFGGVEAGSGGFPSAVPPAYWAGPGPDGRGVQGGPAHGMGPAGPAPGVGDAGPWPTAAEGAAWGVGLPGGPGAFADAAAAYAGAGSGPDGAGLAGGADASWSAAPGRGANPGPGGTGSWPAPVGAADTGIPGAGMPAGMAPGGATPGGAFPGSGFPGGVAADTGMPGGTASGVGMPGGAFPGAGTLGGMAPGSGMPGGAVAGGGAPAGAVSGGGLPGGDGRGGVGGSGDAGLGGPRSAEEVMDVIVEIVHTRTGYPRDMLAPELDLEADLSIDSIKRVEIIGALADRIGLPQDPGGSAESAIEELSRIKTLRGIVDWVSGHTARPEAPAAEAVAAATAPPALDRLRVELQALPPAPGEPEVLRGLRIGVVGDLGDGQGVGPAVAGALRARGVDVRQLAEADAGFDAVLDLSALRPGTSPVLPEAFPGLQRALTGGVHRLLLVTVRGESAGAGVHGFARSASLEYPGRLIRAVEVHSKEDPERIAAQLLAELSCEPAGPAGPADGTPSVEALASVVYTADGLRVTPRPVPAPLVPGDGTPPLDAGSVVLLTGGARGITARTALALATATGCHVELMGRTPQPAAEADEFGHATDRVALRAALIATGLRTPAEIEAAASRILAEREVRATLAALATVAASVGYHCADVTDEQAVRAVVAAVRARHGRLDGIVHGAGTLSDGLLRDKQPASFAEVFTTKVAGARHLAAAAAEHGAAPAPRFLALFGSVAGVYGNRGQTDYAAANDALDGLAHLWAENFPGRVLSVDWGPWAAEAGGMVSPELARAYTRRGIPLIAPDEGGAAFLAELAHGTDVQVVLMAAEGHEGLEGSERRG